MNAIPVLECGDCRDVLLEMAARGETFDSCVTDPPYHLTSVVDRFGKAGSAPAKSDGATGIYARASRGFMGKEWDGGDIAFRPETWRAVWDVLKPGAHLAAFGGTRTFHRMAVAIEDAGFELRDTLMWVYGTGFPKSHDVSKGIDKRLGVDRTEVVGSKLGRPGMAKDGSNRRSGFDSAFGGDAAGALSSDILAPATPEAAAWQGWGTALKPAWEPIILARKPLEGTVAGNVLQFGTGGLNIDASRIPLAVDDSLQDGVVHVPRALDKTGAWGFQAVDRAPGLGRWPANVLHDGSDEVESAFAAFGQKGGAAPPSQTGSDTTAHTFGKYASRSGVFHGDSGTASRFFYCAKAGAADRIGSKHPTVKPQSLMRWLSTLLTPPGGHVLDLFAGSGSTLQAAFDCGFAATGIEMDPEYQADIRRRIEACATTLADDEALWA